mmetsp:Transcript_11169/g.24606  ORF Transcript_11169/g.24606 Transcript_11169/m.24606 type:complete len:121 (-) Transcript_11169:3690-4052(-)
MDSETPSEESPNDDDDNNNNNNSPTTKHIDDYIKNLFEVPTKNIELAFGLVLGLIKEQSTEIGYVKRAQSEALVRNDEIREHIVHQFTRRHWRSTFRDFTKSLSPRMIVRLITTTSLQLS